VFPKNGARLFYEFPFDENIPHITNQSAKGHITVEIFKEFEDIQHQLFREDDKRQYVEFLKKLDPQNPPTVNYQIESISISRSG
jgi:hypothetical protein